MSDIESTTMHYVAELLYNIDPSGLDRTWQELSPEEWHPWHMKAVAVINAAEPLWRSRTASPEDRIETVGVLQSLSRMALLRGIPMLGKAESTYDREKAVQDWIAECAERYEKLGRV